MKRMKLAIVFIAATFFVACKSKNNSAESETNTSNSNAAASKVIMLDTTLYNTELNGKPVKLYTIKNSTGAYATITNYGGRVASIVVPDKNGVLTDVVLGYDSVKTYQKPGEGFFGAIIGRYGNRIGNASFKLNGSTYKLEANDNGNSLHGGVNGFYAKVWDVAAVTDSSLTLTYLSPDGEAGYPGNMEVKVIYTLTHDNALLINYEATTDKETLANLTNHAYFNLSGEGAATITDHLLTIKADSITPVNAQLIPTGILQAVKGSPFDFTTEKTIAKDIDKTDEQLKFGKGYDHNFVLQKHDANVAIAKVKSPITGIVMEIFTTEPGLQFYSGNFMDGKTNDGKAGKAYPYRSAFCLETQHYPDSPNQAGFPSTVLKPGELYKTQTSYKFSTEQ